MLCPSVLAMYFRKPFSSGSLVESLPFSACPPGAFQTLSLPKVQSEPAVAARYLVKLSVVPDESDRWIARIGADGRVAFGLSPLIAASSQVFTVPAKILASVAGLN